MSRLELFSNALLNLQVAARQKAIDQYQEGALAVIQDILPFDKAWWGIMSPQGKSYRLHGSCPYNLPPGFVSMWEDLKSDDTLAKAVEIKPKQTVYFDQRKFDEAPGLATLMGEHGIGQAFCTSVYLPSETAFVFLSLYREHGAPKFNANERVLNQTLMPHLCSFWEANRIAQLEQLKSSFTHERVPMAIVDRQFQVLNAESDFFDVLRKEWPHWTDGGLPAGLVACLKSPSGDGIFKLSHVVGRRYFLGEFCMVALRERQRVDLLSKREHAVAESFAGGDSYKQIARNMNISPATERHYLRVIYEKLDVSDKAEMASLLKKTNILFEDKTLAGRYQEMRHTYIL
jgi:DNA-binding CsgD family transcriptional regulator